MPAFCTLTALRWEGELPIPGQYIKAERGRTAYLVHVVKRPTKPGTKYVARFVCERERADRLPPGVIAHHWRWSRR